MTWAAVGSPGQRWLAAALLAACVGSGCAVVNAPRVPGEVLRLVEPDTRSAYRMYVPSVYDPARPWPLAVVCHAAAPFDSPALQIDEWKALAEAKGFLVVAPELKSVAAGLGRESRLAALRRDEEAIAAILPHVRAARNVDVNRVFIIGWLGGGYTAMHVGLRNPDVFRAIALRQPYFDPAFAEACVAALDFAQPVHVVYGPTDFHREESRACVQWLREHRMPVVEQETSAAHRRQPGDTYAFLRRVVEGQPWLRVQIEGVDPAVPLAVRFRLRSSADIAGYEWNFGDGGTSKLAEPEHTYATGGVYTVRVIAQIGSKRYARQVQVRVPPLRLGAATQPATPL